MGQLGDQLAPVTVEGVGIRQAPPGPFYQQSELLVASWRLSL